jgi:hypothetical protein
MKFISDGQQRLFSLGLTGGGLVAMAGGAMLAFWNPQYLNTRDVSQLYSDGLDDSGSVVARDGKQSHALGTLLLAGGMSLSWGVISGRWFSQDDSAYGGRASPYAHWQSPPALPRRLRTW